MTKQKRLTEQNNCHSELMTYGHWSLVTSSLYNVSGTWLPRGIQVRQHLVLESDDSPIER